MAEPLPDPSPTTALRRSVTALTARLRAQGPRTGGLSRGKAAVLGNLRVQGPMTPSALAAAQRVQPQTLTRVLAGLQRDRLIRRSRDAADGRRQLIELTTKGRATLARDAQARDDWLESAIAEALTAEDARLVLAAAGPLGRLAAAGRGDAADGAGGATDTRPADPVRGATIAPILPTHDLRLTFDFLDSIGFDTFLDDDGDEYGFARRGPIDLHYSRTDPYDPFTQAGMAYVYVLDADALYEELLAVAGLPRVDLPMHASFVVGGDPGAALRERWERDRTVARLGEIADRPWQVREFPLIDPAGNLFRIGHLLPPPEDRDDR
jgi:DNA-binding MarR family transcriptional regulator